MIYLHPSNFTFSLFYFTLILLCKCDYYCTENDTFRRTVSRHWVCVTSNCNHFCHEGFYAALMLLKICVLLVKMFSVLMDHN